MSLGRDSGLFAPYPGAPSERVVCEHAERCGGCPVIGLGYSDQLIVKRGRVVQSVARYASLELVYTEPVIPADPITEYRTRAKLIVAPSGRLGLFAKGGGHQVVDIPNCRVLSPLLARVATLLRERIIEQEASGGALCPFDGTRGALRAVDLREVRTEDGARALVTFVVEKKDGASSELKAAAVALMKEIPEIVGVAANVHEGDSPQILGTYTMTLAGVDKANDRLGKSVHIATFGSFVQAHRGQTERVHGILADAMGLTKAKGGSPASTRAPGTAGNQASNASPRVLDLYGGSGAIALSLATLGATVHLVESFGPATESARAAAVAQGLSVSVQNADSATSLRSLVERREKFDAVVVNPPRRGMGAQARELVCELGAPLIAYVSCDPDTLARDLDHLARLGYAASSLQPLDMIPLTDEVETVAILRRGALAPPKIAFDDDEILIVEKSAHEGVASDNDSRVSLTTRTRRIPGAENAVAASHLESGTSGLIVFVRRPELLARWREILSHPATRRVFVCAARGVTPSKGAITRDLREDGKLQQARTRYRRLAIASGHSVLRVIPEQERTHQVRRHLSAIGHAVLGDERYGHPPTNRFFEEKNGLDRTFMHCVRLEFLHPKTNNRLIIEGPLPGDLRSVLERTSGPGTLRFLDHKNALGASSGPSSSSSLPPAPDSMHERGSVLDVDASVPSLRPDLIGDTDDDDFGGRNSGGF